MRVRAKRKTKIVATLGPASSSREVIREMIEAGLNVARLNFSHGSHEDHTALLKLIREEAAAAERHVAVFQDLCGPKLRIADVADRQIVLEAGAKIELRHGKVGNEEHVGTPERIFIEIFKPEQVIRSGEKILLAEGRVILLAEKVHSDHVSCVVLNGGPVRSRCGISLPESQLNLPCLTEKDLIDLKWGFENKIDFVALSFVGSQEDIRNARKEMLKLGEPIPIISKVERASSLDHISGIVESSDAVMVARGDLGLELPLERVPSAQRLIIGTANFSGTPVITATQMLMSMVKEVRPTRAEVSDVSTAVRDGTDAVMLSEETAVGDHPALAVKTLSNIVEEAERELNFERNKPSFKRSDRAKVADAVCFAACSAAEKLSTTAIIACTETGYTARLLAKYRPQQALYAATSQRSALIRMVLYWGIEPVLINVEEGGNMEEEVLKSMIAIRDNFGVKPGSRVVVTVGLRSKSTGSTNVMEIREIPRAS